MKHNGPLTDDAGRPLKAAVPASIMAYDRIHPLDLWSQASAEAQAAAIADDIAYNAHDIDDGLRSGIITTDAVREVCLLAAFWRRSTQGIRASIPRAHRPRIAAAADHDLRRGGHRRGLAATRCARAGQRRRREAGRSARCRLSAELAVSDRAIKDFLFPRPLRSMEVMTIMEGAEQMVDELFDALIADPASMPQDWRAGWAGLATRPAPNASPTTSRDDRPLRPRPAPRARRPFGGLTPRRFCSNPGAP